MRDEGALRARLDVHRSESHVLSDWRPSAIETRVIDSRRPKPDGLPIFISFDNLRAVEDDSNLVGEESRTSEGVARMNDLPALARLRASVDRG